MSEKSNDTKAIMARRAQFVGFLERVPPSDPGERPSYLLMNPEGSEVVTVNGEPRMAIDIPVVVQADRFGKEDLSGKVRMTILIERIPMTEEEKNAVSSMDTRNNVKGMKPRGAR